MKRIATPIAELAADAHFDAVVVGSGYGAGVAASRLARMGLAVAILERGPERLPGEFPDTPDKALDEAQIDSEPGHLGRHDALFDLRVNDDMNVLVGCGLGGTSLINANVALRADPRVFDDPVWPAALNDADLTTGYERALAMLAPRPYPRGEHGFPDLNKLRAMDQAAAALGAGLSLPPINVSFTDGPNPAGVHQPACNLCGDCCSGCNTGAKSTTQMNYLPDAAAHGAKIFCGVQVRSLSKCDDGRWCIHYTLPGIGREAFGDEELTLTAAHVVLGAGTLGSTEILLRSRERGLPLSDSLGTRFSGNGDVLAFGYNNDAPVDGIGLGHKAAVYDWRVGPERPVGPTIAGLIDLRGTPALDDGMVIEEGAIPGGLGIFMPGAMAAGAAALGSDTDSGDLLSERAREVESLVHGPYCGAVNNTQTFLVMSHDGAGGTMALRDDRLRVTWPGVGGQPGFAKVAARLRAAVAASGGNYVPNPIWSDLLQHRLITVHPLGGCPMGEDARHGVVDHQCRVYAGNDGTAVHDGLLVCDGSVMPRSLGVNPLLSISAVSERAMIHLARALGRDIDMSPAAVQPDLPEAARTIGIRFTERMAGTMTDTTQGVSGPASFVVTISARDLDGFLRQRGHLALAEGSVDLPALSPLPLTIVGGRFNLFTAVDQRVETRQMEYRLPLRDAEGNLYFLHGRKLIHDDRGFDLWADTSTLAATVHRGGHESGPVLFTGTLHIAPLDFLRQMRTMTVTDAPDLASRLAAMRRFGFFFAGQLFESFGGSFARPSLYDEGHARPKRPLRVGEPELHHFTTRDGKTLRLTRCRGGSKGPLILAHGLGVSSLIFSIDTIETNLLEYLYAAGYDCWMLDFRASIDLGYVHDQFTADDVADQDYPAAISYVREKTGAPSVQMMVHCYGAMSFAMAMLGGLEGVRAAAMSQIAAHADVPFFPQRMLAQLRAPDMMKAMGVRVLDSRATTHRDALARLVDAGIGHLYPFQRQDRTRSVTSRRITAIFGPLYQLDQLNQATLDAMPEMFGKANVAAFRQLARIARAGHVLRADGTSLVTDAHLRRFAVPTLFVHGALNRAFLPSGTKRTRDELSRVNGAHLYQRVEIAGAGHIDSIFGTRAAEAVFPAIVRHLDQTARV